MRVSAPTLVKQQFLQSPGHDSLLCIERMIREKILYIWENLIGLLSTKHLVTRIFPENTSRWMSSDVGPLQDRTRNIVSFS